MRMFAAAAVIGIAWHSAAAAVTVQQYSAFPRDVFYWGDDPPPNAEQMFDQDADTIWGSPLVGTTPIPFDTPDEVYPVDVVDDNHDISPNQFDNPFSPNGRDDDGDGVIDGNYAGGLAMSPLDDVSISPGHFLVITYSFDGIDSPYNVVLQASPAGAFNSQQSSTIFWNCDDLDDVGNTYLFRLIDKGGSDYVVEEFQVNVVAPVAGDYNFDEIVNAADYTVWRDTLGQEGAGLAADGDVSGAIDQGDYDIWKSHFGETAPGSGAAGALPSRTAVPEPGSAMLAAAAALAVISLGWRRR